MILCALAALWRARPARAQVEDFITGTYVNFLTLKDGSLIYKADCGQPGLAQSFIVSRPVEGDYFYHIYNPSVCNSSAFVLTEVGLDDTYAYWLNGLGQVRRRNIFGTGTTETVTTTPNPINLSVNGQVAAGPSYVYWTEELTEFHDRSILYRAHKTPGSSPEVLFDYSADNLASVNNLEVLNDAHLIYLLGDGRLMDAQYKLFGMPPLSFYAWQRSTVSSAAESMFLDESRLFWTDRSSDGHTIYFRSAPLTNLTSVTLHYTSVRSSAHAVLEFVADDANLYYQDLTTASTGPLLRKSLTSGAAPVEIATLLYPATHMVLSDRHVIWRKNNTTISRLPINAGAVTRDLQANGLEVVQLIQNTSNENPLVMGKPTFARFWAHIASSSTGETSLNFWPEAYLYGEKNGVPLPGSPLTPFQSPALGSGLIFRDVLEQGFMFRLPDAWTRQGAITLRGVVNPTRVVSETSYANNTSTFNANFLRKAPICMVMKPTRTHQGTIYIYNPAMESTFDYIEALLPTSELRVVWGGGVIEEPYDPFHWIGDGGPFEVSTNDDDGWTVLTELTIRKILSTERYCESSGGFDHYVAMLKPHASMPWTGFAHRGDGGIGLTMAASAFFARLQPDPFGVPLAATTECQELSHNYGRLHVDCGNPANVDPDYPYDPATLFSPGFDYIGFDPLRRRLILPNQAKDFMSYCSPKWISDYTWKALVTYMGNLPSAAGTAVGSGAGLTSAPKGGSLLVGFYAPLRKRAAFNQILPLADPRELAAAQSVIAGMKPREEFELRASAKGTVKQTYPVYMNDVPADEGAEESSFFLAITDVDPVVDRIEFINKTNMSQTLGSLSGGGQPPQVMVLSPAAGAKLSRANPLQIAWAGSDPDNDPLVYTVRFSQDAGANWRVLLSGTPETKASLETAGIPGSAKCQIQVIASDGILTGSATSDLFQLEPGVPQPYIFTETSKGKNCLPLPKLFVGAGEPLLLHARAFDDEDGDVPGTSLFWNVTGPLNLSGTGREYAVEDLPPGDYLVRLQATDSDKQTGIAQMTLTVDPHFVEEAAAPIVVDGYGDDPGYASDARPLKIPYSSGEAAFVRMVHGNGNLYICVTSLRNGTDSSTRVGVSVDVNGSGGTQPQAGDLLYEVYADGRVRTLTGNGSVFVDDVTPQGLSAAVAASGPIWSAELCLDPSRWGGWNGQTVRLAVGHYHIDLIGEQERAWPVTAAENAPASWGAVVLGPDPNNPTDSDHDGMPDNWERSFFVSLKQKGDADADKDGVINRDEFAAGTDPTDPASRFAVTASQGPDGVLLKWTFNPGHVYTVHRSPNLNVWEPVAYGLASNQWLDANPGGGNNFYRVEVCPER
jgi:hypothetical protein